MKLNYDKKIEKYLINYCSVRLNKGRIGYDLPHTLTVVFYLKKIIQSLNNTPIDQDVIIITGYLHDIGYSRLSLNLKKQTHKNINKFKNDHMTAGSNHVKKLLKESIFNQLSSTQKLRIVHLVRVYDNLVKIHDIDEIILMEADTLACLNVARVKPTIDAKSNILYLNEVKKHRFPLFQTKYSLLTKDKLFRKRQQYFFKILFNC